MTNSTAYLLVSHGSRDLRPHIGLLNLAEKVRQELGQKDLTKEINYHNNYPATLNQTQPVLVGTACLELADISLHQSVIQFAQLVLKQGISKINIIPLFLLPGVHVCEDLPLEISLAKQELTEEIEINLSSYLGENLAIKKLLQEEFKRLNCESKIILAHGSRRQGSNQIIEDMAVNLSAMTAYWSISPNLETRIMELSNQGSKRIAIVPYFLFTGGIIDAIAQQVETLQIKYPKIEIKLGETLDKNPELVTLIIKSLSK